MAKVLILDQSKSIRNTLRERLEFEGIAAESAENEAAASVLCERIPFDLIISDHETRLPESDVPFIVLSSEATVDSAIKALRNGAQDYLTKPIDMNRLMQSIRQTLEQAAEAPRTAAKAKAKRSSAGHTEEIIGTSEQMQHVRRLIDKVAPCDARVLITGENGTGKELVARWLHAKSNRAGAPFDQPHNAVADKTAILLIGMQGQSPRSQHMIAASRQIADRIEQRPVQVENHQFRIHIKSLNYK